MKLKLHRVYKGDDYTIGKLYIDGVAFCDTLEDKYRDLSKEPKVPGETCIPNGTYKITMDVISPKYSRRKQYDFCNGKLPRLLNVPKFEGILIHIGNYPKDTEGCILVGVNSVKGAVMNSTATFKRLYEILLTDKDNITIEIV